VAYADLDSRNAAGAEGSGAWGGGFPSHREESFLNFCLEWRVLVDSDESVLKFRK